MKYLFLIITTIWIMQSCQQPVTEFSTYDEYPIYQGSDLGVAYSPESTTIKYWAPSSIDVIFKTYSSGSGETLMAEHPMQRGTKGLWELTLTGDHSGVYYAFQGTTIEGALEEVPGPYAKAVGVNGKRGMILDMETTNPEGWEVDKRPALNGPEDIVLYEMHVRDMTIHASSGAKNQGKFLGLAEKGTTNEHGDKTGLDHLVELGVTHIHLLPSFDYRSVDESRLEEPQYNWGYDPENYNALEGSYSTDPNNAEVRIKEFKTMVKAMHDNGLRVILDVVYNHTGSTEQSVFNQSVPGYFYRHNEDGSWSDAASCGNETASEREMMRKYIVESVKYWVNEYHLDGFRFDLMGIHDTETMNLVSQELKKIDPSIFVYGEGWTAGSSPIPDSERALKVNTADLTDIAAFSDDLRDGLKGSVFVEEERGFASGLTGLKESIKFGIVASTQHDQVDYSTVNYSKAPWSPRPTQTISYVSCHDNNTLYDKLYLSVPDASSEQLSKMHRLSQTIVLTSQGVSFLHAGTDFLRTKNGVENSYNSPDSINQIDWNRKHEFRLEFDYYKDLIALRKNHSAFRMTTTEQVQKHLQFVEIEDPNIVAYQISDNASGDSWKNIFVVFNGNFESREIPIPEGEWEVVLEDYQIDENGLRSISGGNYKMGATSALILVQK